MTTLIMILAAAVMLLNLLQILFWGKDDDSALGSIALFCFSLLVFLVAGVQL